MARTANLNILSKRYATSEMNRIFSEEYKIVLERDFWIAVMKAQKNAGVKIPDDVIRKYEKAKENIDFKLIEKIEKVTKHDVKARIEAFVKTAGADEHIHKGLTSRDVTDNVEQLQNLAAARLIFGKMVSVLRHFVDKSRQYENIIMTARTHHQPAQPTLLGRRFSMWAEELYIHLVEFESFISGYSFRGVKGPVATQFDMMTLLEGKDRLKKLEADVAKLMGMENLLDSPGQVYPRSLDFKLLSHLAALSSAIENFAKGMRHMAGYELVTEGFRKGQVGSSAMPHKMNTAKSERICAFAELLKMYCDGASRLAGDQWEEGDVSCSVIRRVIIPDSFYACDGMIETALTVLNGMEHYEAVIDSELEKYLPFLATTEMLVSAVKRGIGRERAHEIIKKYAVEEALSLRTKKGAENKLIERICSDKEFSAAGITKEDLNAIMSDKKHFVGNAKDQIMAVDKKSQALIKRYQKESGYEPGEMI